MITNGMQRLIAFVVTATLVLAACGGGSGNNVAGIDRTGAPVIASYGTVSAFGSVVVNGVHYDTSQATFVIDGDCGHAGRSRHRRRRARQRVRSTPVAPRASRRPCGSTTTWKGRSRRSIRSANTFVALGQLVRVSADTSFDARYSARRVVDVGGRRHRRGFRSRSEATTRSTQRESSAGRAGQVEVERHAWRATKRCSGCLC